MPLGPRIKTAIALSLSIVFLISCGGGSDGTALTDAQNISDTVIVASNVEAVAASGLEILEGIINSTDVGSDFADVSLMSGVVVTEAIKASAKPARGFVSVAMSMLNRLSYQQDMPVATGVEITRTVEKADEICTNDGTLTIKAKIAKGLNYTPGDKAGFIAENCAGDGIVLDGQFEMVVDGIYPDMFPASDGTTKSIVRIRARFINLQIRSKNQSENLNGDIVIDLLEGASPLRSSKPVVTSVSGSNFESVIEYANGTILKTRFSDYVADFGLSRSEFAALLNAEWFDMVLTRVKSGSAESNSGRDMSLSGMSLITLDRFDHGHAIGEDGQRSATPYRKGRFRLSGKSSSLTVTVIGDDLFQLDLSNSSDPEKVTSRSIISYAELRKVFQ